MEVQIEGEEGRNPGLVCLLIPKWAQLSLAVGLVRFLSQQFLDLNNAHG
jgi:hypothetical protein